MGFFRTRGEDFVIFILVGVGAVELLAGGGGEDVVGVGVGTFAGAGFARVVGGEGVIGVGTVRVWSDGEVSSSSSVSSSSLSSSSSSSSSMK